MKTQSNQICHLPQMIHSSTEQIEMAHNERFCTTTKISKTLVVVVGHLTFEYICIEKKDKKPVADVADWIHCAGDGWFIAHNFANSIKTVNVANGASIICCAYIFIKSRIESHQRLPYSSATYCEMSALFVFLCCYSRKCTKHIIRYTCVIIRRDEYK